MGSKGKGYRELEVGGFAVLLGKGARDNDALTFRVAEPRDFWLHVAEYSGSHVVVRNPDNVATLPPEVLIRAAELAAWYSRARGARGKIEVHWCRVADVRKPRGAPAGLVELRHWESMRVYAKGIEGED